MGRKSRSKKLRSAEPRDPDRLERIASAEYGGHGARLAPSSTTKKLLFAGALVAAVFLVYQPAWRGGFIFDDDLHLLNNPVLKTGGFVRAWTPGSYINYWPLTFTVYRLEFEAWRLNTPGFHLVNIALHAVIALLVWRVLVELDVPGAMFAAAIFALHPVNVEGVAWIAQLKGLLSLLFALVSTLLYLMYDRRGGRMLYAAALAAFCLSALAKGMVLTLPIVLLACGWWRRGSLQRRDLACMVPFVLVGAVMAGVEVWAQRLANAGGVRSDNLPSRIAVAGCAVWFYFGKLVWPSTLCFVYPRWKIENIDVLWALPGVLMAILFGLALWRRGAWGRPIVMLIVCYVGLLLPVLGFLNIYYMRYSLVADHWQYAAAVVPCAVLAGVAAAWTNRQRNRRPVAWAMGLSLLAVLAALTSLQSRIYADSEKLWSDTLEKDPNCWLAYNVRGHELADCGEVDQAIAHYHKALEIKPDYSEAHSNLGACLTSRGEIDQAIEHCRKAVEIKPEDAQIHNNLGVALAARGRVDEAVDHYRKALAIKSDYLDAHNNLGNALAGSGHVDEAIEHYEKVLQIEPKHAEAHNNLGFALTKRGAVDQAIAHYRTSLAIKPDYAETHFNLGRALADVRKFDEAILHYRRTLEIKPGHPGADNYFGMALASLGKVDEAIIQYRKALEIRPDDVNAYNNLGNILSNHERFDEAIANYQKAAGDQPRLR